MPSGSALSCAAMSGPSATPDTELLEQLEHLRQESAAYGRIKLLAADVHRCSAARRCWPRHRRLVAQRRACRRRSATLAAAPHGDLDEAGPCLRRVEGQPLHDRPRPVARRRLCDSAATPHRARRRAGAGWLNIVVAPHEFFTLHAGDSATSPRSPLRHDQHRAARHAVVRDQLAFRPPGGGALRHHRHGAGAATARRRHEVVAARRLVR